MRLWKYVILSEITPVVFDAPLQHKDMVKLGRITSAGYFAVQAGTVAIAGEALSITVPNGRHDAAILQRFLDGEDFR